jgi:hypothetical protein
MLSDRTRPVNQPADQLLQYALSYAARGWSIIPVIGKKPAGLWKPFQTRPADPSTLRRLFARDGITGLAVVLGQVSGGLACRDFDQADGYHRWAQRHPADAALLPTVRTGRGYHVYGRLDQDEFANLGDGELRADSGHYVVLPPSAHPEGGQYSWVVPLPDDDPLPLLPVSLRQSQQTGEEDRPPQQPSNPLHVSHGHNACVPPAALGAIQATLPDGPGQRNRRLFDLARRLKGIVGLDTSPGVLNVIVSRWHARALPVITTKPFGETWSDFQAAWLRARTPHGAGLRDALEAARRAPERLDDNEELGILAALCRHLSAAAGGQPFYLSCRSVEELFGIGRMTAWRWLNTLRFYELIEPVQVGTLKQRRATTWRWTGG